MTTTFGLAEKLASGQSITIQATGDSTVYGAYDTANSGWVGRLGVAFGNAFNTTVTISQYNVIGIYNAAATLRTAGGSNQVIVRDAGMPGWTTSGVWAALLTMLNISNPDVIIHGTGFNDVNIATTPAQFVTNIRQLITGMKARCPGVPIIITTENVANSSSYDAAFNALANDLVGQSLPISPPLLASTTVSGVWLMDTRQAYGNTWQSSLMTDTLHPNATGYQTQADWMYSLLVSGYGSPAGIAPAITTTSLSQLTRSVAFSQTLSATGSNVTWSLVGGALPAGLFLNSVTGTIAGVPTEFGGTYTFTLRVTNANGFGEQSFTGTINRNTIPFIANDEAVFKSRGLGLYYPIAHRMKLSGTFRPVIVRH